MLAQRLISAFIGITILLSLMFYIEISYIKLLFLLIFILTVLEITNIFLKKEAFVLQITFILMCFIFLLLLHIKAHIIYLNILFIIFFIIYLIANIPSKIFKTKAFDIPHNFNKMLESLFFAIYIVLPFYFLIELLSLYKGRFIVLYLIIIVWVGDSLAFFAGTYLKKYYNKKLFEQISPNKTIIGSIFSILGSIIAGLIVVKLFHLKHIMPNIVLLSLSINIVAQLGDLFESFIKRNYNIKDSSNLIPGHGGVLDRLDSFLFAIPFLYWYIVFFK